MKTLPAPEGKFLLQREHGQARCPGCGELVAEMWVYIADATPTIHRPVGCVNCAQK